LNYSHATTAQGGMGKGMNIRVARITTPSNSMNLEW
jgi:hypothetical protein